MIALGLGELKSLQDDGGAIRQREPDIDLVFRNTAKLGVLPEMVDHARKETIGLTHAAFSRQASRPSRVSR